MITDIHTHQKNPQHPAVRNLFPENADAELSLRTEGWFSVGLHPWHIGKQTETHIRLVEKWSHNPKVVMIGECGLDKHANASIIEQTAVLKQHVVISEAVKKPLIIHCVGCFNELLVLKKQLQPQQLWIIHGFRAKPQLARQLLSAGCAISLGEHFNPATAAIIPAEKLFFESDESTLPFEKICSNIIAATSLDPTDNMLSENFRNISDRHCM